MRSRMRSNCLAGRAAKSMPARLISPRKTTRRSAPEVTMAKTDGLLPPDKSAKLASPARLAAFRTGLSAETRAAAYLIAKGYRILAKRFRTPYGEIDIVAKRRNLVAFVAPSVSGIRCQPLNDPPSRHPDPQDEIERRRPDGPHRAHQHIGRFDLRAAVGSREARPRAFLLHPGQALAARRGAGGAAPVV